MTLFGILFFPFTLIGWIIAGAFGIAGRLFGFFFNLVGGTISLIFSMIMTVVGIALCFSLLGSLFGIPLLILGGMMVMRGFSRG